MIVRWFILLLASFTELLSVGYSQDPTVLAEKLDAFRRNHPHEKVHLHIDRTYYSAGDSLYFKAYITDSESNHFSQLSAVLHIELINDQKLIVKALVFPIIAGEAVGVIEISDSIPGSAYALRAYTNVMRDAGQQFFFERILYVANSNNESVYASGYFSHKEGDSGEQIEGGKRWQPDCLMIIYQKIE